jgi:hypothetical protein
MTSPRTLDPDEPLDDVDKELAHTQLFLLASPLTQPLAQSITALRAELPSVRVQQTDHSDAVQQQEASAVFIDDDCNSLVDEAKVLVLAEAKGNYQAPLYKQLFEGQSPTELKRPILGDQLTRMRTWPAILTSTPSPALQELGARTGEAVGRGNAANDAMAGAQSRLDAFWSGPRAAYVERVNAARKLTFGKLAEIEHSQPKGKLPSGFAERFFLHDTGGRAPRIADVERTIARLQKKLARHESALAEMKQKQASAEKTRQDEALAEKQDKLAAAQKKVDDAARELAVLEAEVGRGGEG